MKHEARNTKLETSPNVQSTNDRKKNTEKSFVWDFGHLDFKFVSDSASLKLCRPCFDIRISNLYSQLRLDADGWGLTL